MHRRRRSRSVRTRPVEGQRSASVRLDFVQNAAQAEMSSAPAREPAAVCRASATSADDGLAGAIIDGSRESGRLAQATESARGRPGCAAAARRWCARDFLRTARRRSRRDSSAGAAKTTRGCTRPALLGALRRDRPRPGQKLFHLSSRGPEARGPDGAGQRQPSLPRQRGAARARCALHATRTSFTAASFRPRGREIQPWSRPELIGRA